MHKLLLYILLLLLSCIVQCKAVSKVFPSFQNLERVNCEEYQDYANEETEFFYDANGNMTQDLDRRITNITYNVLNLPAEITFTGNHKIKNTYAADGRKLSSKNLNYVSTVLVPADDGSGNTVSQMQYRGSGLEHIGNIDYTNTVKTSSQLTNLDLGYAPVRIHNAEGYVDKQNKYCYYRKDHLGNNRQVWNGTNNQVFQQMRYYPSGLPNYYYSSSTSAQPYTFNGKEFIEAHGLDVTDLGWRSVYNAINRFTSPDRFAEKTPWQSPYAHANNNSVNFVDVGGDSIWTTIDEARYYYGHDADGNYGFIGANGAIYSGDNAYANNLKNALNNLRTGGKVGEGLVSDLMTSTNNVTIKNGTSNKADINNNEIIWNPNSTIGGINTDGTTNRPAFIGLGHEMAHIQDSWNGTLDLSVWVPAVGTVIGNDKDIPNAEKYATHIENLLRAENGIPLRTHYSLYNGNGDPFTRIIQKLDARASVFYSNGSVRSTTIVMGVPVSKVLYKPLNSNNQPFHY